MMPYRLLTDHRRTAVRRKPTPRRRPVFEPLERRLVLDAGPLLISELMAVNDGVLADTDGDFSDWIEIYNAGSDPVNLDGWYLTDDPGDMTRWRFPDAEVAADGYLVVFASGKDYRAAGDELHTNFKLDGNGDYLALVDPDGITAAYEFAPGYPEQRADVSYGVSQGSTTFGMPDGRGLTYRVPSETDDALGADWTAEGFDDSAWTGLVPKIPVLITEAGTRTPDYVEIQNLSGGVVNTSGWVAAVNNGNEDINTVHSTLWQLPDLMAADELLYRTDDAGDNYWGEDIAWKTVRNGWVMLLDGYGNVADFVVWSYDASELATLDVEVNGHRITAEDVWNGAPVPRNTSSSNTLKRTGDSDHDNASDWAFTAPGSKGQTNEGLLMPFSVDFSTGVGFSATPTALDDVIQIDVEQSMRGVNASLWTRIPFEVDTPTALNTLKLRMKYNDGFVAYINGQEVARRNAPDTTGWDAGATAARSVGESVAYEQIDVGDSLPALRPGTNVLAIHGMNVDAADDSFLISSEITGSGMRYFLEPTPGAPNVEGILGFVGDTAFSVDRGFFTQPFELQITTETERAEIYYTTDGSEPAPDAASATLATGPITIGETTTLRAAAFREGYQPTNVDTHTYVFVADVVQQSVMSSTITGNPAWGPQLGEALLALPTVSLVSSEFNPATISPERATSIELIFPDGSPGFQVDAGVEHFGGHALNNYPKKSMRISFKSEYGPSRLRFDLFGEGATDNFDQLLLRSGSHDGVFYENTTKGIFVRNRWILDRQLEMGQPAPHGRFVHVYVNGTYWGQHHLMERPSTAFMASYFGGDKEDYEAFNAGQPISGSKTDAWNRMRNSTGNYQTLQQYMDVVNYADYMLLQFYSGNNWDWNAQQNWMAAGAHEPGESFKFFSWDNDMILRRGLNANVIDRGGPMNMWGAIKQHEEFRVLLADRAQKYFFNDGMLTPDRVVEQLEELAGRTETSMIAETARWGQYGAGGFYSPATWRQHLNRVETEIVARRTEVVVQQMRSAGVFPSIDAPALNQYGGQVAAGFELTMEASSGAIYYTLDGSDPRVTGGAVSPSARQYANTPIELTDNRVLKARALHEGEWSALSETEFFVVLPAVAESLAITEINYHPHDPTTGETSAGGPFVGDDFEFIELQNTSAAAMDLSGAQLTDGVTFDFSNGDVTTLAPGEFVVVVRNKEAFAARYGTQINVAGEYSQALRNGGERIALIDRFGEIIRQFEYDDSNGWPGRADGKGATLEVVDAAGDLTQPNNWRSSSEYGGSPGSAGEGPRGDVLVNEVLTHTDGPQLDAIELINTTDAPIDVGGWYLSDSWGWQSSDDNGNYRKYRIADGTIIGAHEYLVFDERHFNASGGVDPQQHPNDFALSGAHGDDAWLLQADSDGNLQRFVDHVEFGAAATGESFGRWPDAQGELYPMATTTLGSANGGPRIGPVVISEVHYDPGPQADADDLEFIEIYNPTHRPVDLTGWRIRKGVDFDFADGVTIGAGETLVILPFDPQDDANAAKWSAFCAEYGVDENQPSGFVGGYTGRQSNSGETIQLQRPDEPPPAEPEFTPYLLEDEAVYDETVPAPNGRSLNRLGIDRWGHDAGSWTSAVATPGTTNLTMAGAAVTGRYAFYNNSAFDDAGAGLSDDDAVAPDKVALLPGNKATLANYTSYVRGINGIMIDVAGLAGMPTADDFALRIGNSDDPSAWAAAPLPASVGVRRGAGADGSDRVTLIWDDYAIAGQWLQVSMLATPNTGLLAADVFYFGNAVAEAGNSQLNAIVNTTDEVVARNFQHGPANLAEIDDPYDYNRDRLVNTTDRTIARSNQTGPTTALKLISAPAVDVLLEEAGALAGD